MSAQGPLRAIDWRRISLLLIVVCAGASRAWAQTNNDFDATGTPYHTAAAGNAQPGVVAGGPTGHFFRLASVTPPPLSNRGTIAFDRTDAVANQVVADFDFRITPPAGGRSVAADGFGFVLLNADANPPGAYGADLPERAFARASLGVGFRIYDNGPNVNAISIAFNEVQLAMVHIDPLVIDLASGQFIHARIVMRPGAGYSDVTVTLTPPSAAPVTVIDRYVVPGFAPYPGRVAFGARSGGLSADHDLDNVQVVFSEPVWDMPFVQMLRTGTIRFISYSPTNFNPARVSPGGPLQELPTPDSITRDLTVLRAAFAGLVLYGTQTDLLANGHGLVPWIVSEARRLGFRAVVVGVWDPRDSNEVDAAAALVNQHASDPGTFAVALCLGNEGIQRAHNGLDGPKYGIAELDTARSRVQSLIGGLRIPIVTSEDLYRYSAVPALKSWGTFLFPIVVPHWNQAEVGAPFTPTRAAEWVRAAGASLAESAFRPVLVKEAAWPSTGSSGQPFQYPYTLETQRQFFEEYFASSATVPSTIDGVFTSYTTALEAFDQYWKQSPDFSSWGLFGRDRSSKPAVSSFLSFTDTPLMTRITSIRTAHVVDLRRRIDALRVRANLLPYGWTDADLAAGLSVVRATHLLDLRVALGDVYQTTGRGYPSYGEPIAPGVTIKASHIEEIRLAVLGIEEALRL